MNPKLLYAPWSEDEVQSLNAYQASDSFHPYTCQCVHGVVLVAIKDGWTCPNSCGYTQNWCMPFMANWSWKKIS